jgi:hypothetical protein
MKLPMKIVEKEDYCDHSGRTQCRINRAYQEVILGNNLTLRRARGLLFNTMTDQQTR